MNVSDFLELSEFSVLFFSLSVQYISKAQSFFRLVVAVCLSRLHSFLFGGLVVVAASFYFQFSSNATTGEKSSLSSAIAAVHS